MTASDDTPPEEVEPRFSEKSDGTIVGCSASVLVQSFSRHFAFIIQKLRFVILVFWLAVSILGLFYGLKFFDETTTEFAPPKGSLSAQAYDVLQEVRLFSYNWLMYGHVNVNVNVQYFPGQANIHIGSIYIEVRLFLRTHTFVLIRYCLQSLNGASLFDGDLGAAMKDFDAKLLQRLRTETVFKSYSSYYTWTTLNQPLLASAYVSSLSDGSTYISVGFDCTDSTKAAEFASTVRNTVSDLQVELQLNQVTAMSETGIEFFTMDSLDGVKKDSSAMDTIILPMALLILALVIQNLPVMIIPILSIATSLLTQFLIMYPIVSRQCY